MKIKIFIVTYNNDVVLDKNLEHIYSSDILDYNYEVNIINNYSFIDPKRYKYPNLNILNNVCRPDFSRGFLARNWNQALFNGFKSISKPDCDLLIAMQNDTFVLPDCFKNTLTVSKSFDFFTTGAGDQYMAWTPSGIKKLGIFDERFCSLACHEGDYFVNAMMIDKERVSINDYHHNRLFNPIKDLNSRIIKPDAHLNSSVINKKWHPFCIRFFSKKWNIPDTNWSSELKRGIIHPQIERYFTYPDFECDINRNTLKYQKYCIEI
ncbi:MAG: hypothetical protein ISQ42_04860 [Flavobacteriaceae bacterium]|nr:hypothetical protein [Flavobacteriaceae bacterium]